MCDYVRLKVSNYIPQTIKINNDKNITLCAQRATISVNKDGVYCKMEVDVFNNDDELWKSRVEDSLNNINSLKSKWSEVCLIT